jgi:hypothetical protein
LLAVHVSHCRDECVWIDGGLLREGSDVLVIEIEQVIGIAISGEGIRVMCIECLASGKNRPRACLIGEEGV